MLNMIFLGIVGWIKEERREDLQGSESEQHEVLKSEVQSDGEGQSLQ